MCTPALFATGRSGPPFSAYVICGMARAASILAAYKQTMLHGGLPVGQWVARMLWYCANGAELMQSTGNGGAGLIELQEEVVGYFVVVQMAANWALSQPSMGEHVGQHPEDDNDDSEDPHR